MKINYVTMKIITLFILLSITLTFLNGCKKNEPQNSKQSDANNGAIDVIKNKTNSIEKSQAFALTDVKKICSKNKTLCGKLYNDDGQCATARDMTIIMRYRTSLNPSDENRYNEILAAESAQQCLALAASIEGTSGQDSRTKRLEARYEALASIKQLQQELQTSQDPIVLFYQWQTLSNKKSRAEFLAYEKTNKLETPELQYALAMLYARDDPTKTITILNHALELYHPSPQSDYITARDQSQQNRFMHAITTLATLTFQQHKLEQSYIWSKIAQLLAIPIATGYRFDSMFPLDDSTKEKLDQLSQTIAESIKTGQYTKDLMKPY